MRLAALGLVAAATISCAGPEAPAFVVRDSADVEIVESRRPRDPGAIRVAPEPMVRLGTLGGDASQEFSGVVGAVRLASARIAVGDFASQEIRIFDDDGVVASVGGRGAGPGEFSGLSRMGATDDGGLWAYDFVLRRLAEISREGTLTSSATVGPEPPALDAVGLLPTGDFLFKQLWGVAATAAAAEGGLRRDLVPLVRFDGQGVLVDTVVDVPGREVHLTQENGRGVMTTPPFGRNAVATLRGGRLVVGAQDDFVLDEYLPDGTLVRRIVVPGEDLRLTSGEVTRVIEQRVALTPDAERPALRSALTAIPAPPRRPAYGVVLGDRAMRLWVSEWSPAGLEPSRTWRVFDADGRWLCEVEMPAAFTPMDIGEDWILGVERDDLDVEYVTLYALRRDMGD